jgi:hypothetical protein
MRRLLKRIGKSAAARAALAALIASYIRLVCWTTRFEVQGLEPIERMLAEGRPLIITLWHGRMLLCPCFWSRRLGVSVLVSRHRDGALISRAMTHFGMRAIHGSSSRGGADALRAMLKELKAGNSIGITPDGPRGPRMRAQGGAIQLACLSGVPLVPVSYGVSRRRIIGSWDRFLLALPFARGVFLLGEPISVPRDADSRSREAARQALEDQLNKLTREADRLMGQTPIEPAPAGDRVVARANLRATR